MAAFTDVTVEEVRNKPASLSYRANAVYTRVVKFTIPTSSTVAAGDLSGLKLPPGTMVLAAMFKADTSLGSTTIALSTETASVIFVVAKTMTDTDGEALIIADSLGLVVPESATADDQVILTLAAATSPASEVACVLTLVLVNVGEAAEIYESFDT